MMTGAKSVICAIGMMAIAGTAIGAMDGTAPNALVEQQGSLAVHADRASAVRDDVFTDRVVVRFRSGVDISALMGEQAPAAWSAARGHWGVQDVRRVYDWPARDPALAARLGMDRLTTVWVSEGTDVRTMVQELRGLSALVESADVDACVHAHVPPPVDDALYPQQWSLHNTGQASGGQPGAVGADINVEGAWSIASQLLTPTVVAILDTGVSQSHPDLLSVQVPGQNLTVTPSNTAYDDNTQISHGTYCAGIAGAAANNAIGIAGVAPNVRIMPVKVLSTVSFGSQTNCQRGIRWAADHGARIISMSLGWGSESTSAGIADAVTYASSFEIVMCSSTGNTPGAPVGFPARLPGVIAVGGTNNLDQPFSGGTTGPEIDIVAPADSILVTSDDASGLNGYSVQTGTSMACPLVAGTAALILGMNPALSAAQVRDILLSTADDRGTAGWDQVYGSGRLNAQRAVQAAFLTLNCRADLDLSGDITVDDVFAFLNLFFAGDQRADFDQSGVLDVGDLFSFLSSWFGGC